ncbi:MAG: hypothetical protein ITG00_12115 [Flavobacterium sp.]|nr:hypothetical protein [Flavobacterium sp.]
MKSFAITVLAIMFSTGLVAQNKNVTETSKTTVTTVKDSDGEKKVVRTQNTEQQQNIEFQNAESNALNKDVKATPVQVTSTTQITTPDGTTRTVDVDRSAYYTLGDHKYQVRVDNKGYTMMNDNRKAGVLRQLSPNSYIYQTKDRTSVGYFDEEGNLVLQTYDDKKDDIIVEIYKRSN